MPSIKDFGKNTYATANMAEYWAEGVQSWFDVNAEANPSNGFQNNVNTRAELKAHDSGLDDLISEFMPVDDWRPGCS